MTVEVESACNGSMEITRDVEGRLVVVRFVKDTSLTAEHGNAMVAALRSIREAEPDNDKAPFGMLADAKGVTGTDADYRAVTGKFFGDHRDSARIALINLRPVIRVVAEMFRVGIRLHMRTFSDEAGARAWLVAEGVAGGAHGAG